MVQLELPKWLAREAGEDKADQVIAFTVTCVVADLMTSIALVAADFALTCKLGHSRYHHLPDGRQHGVDLLSCHRHLDGLAGVHYVAQVHG